MVELNKSRALDLLHELYDNISASRSNSFVSAENISVSHIFTGGYQVSIKTNVDDHLRNVINDLVKRHKLYMKEKSGQVTLRSIGD